ncbi:MAG: hypothetical protein PHT67_01575 [Candidatus Pacebacteria bacterium]|nr:hypothetical protein [Candidatus Paceibacterota bacterium]MDD5013408.1 hypothetical protein [Candidatus Paceibacterota bacterium]
MNKKIILSLIAFVALVGIIAPVAVFAQSGAPEQCKITKDAVADQKRVDKSDMCPSKDSYCQFDKGYKGTKNDDGTFTWDDSVKYDCGLCCLLNSVYTVTDWIFLFLMALSALMIIIGAFNYVTSAGNPEKTKTGRDFIMYAAIGIAIALFAKAIPAIVKMMIGMN